MMNTQHADSAASRLLGSLERAVTVLNSLFLNAQSSLLAFQFLRRYCDLGVSPTYLSYCGEEAHG